MNRHGYRAEAIVACLVVTMLTSHALAAGRDEAGLRAADAAQLEAVRVSDQGAIAAMTHPAFRLFAPEGYVGTRDRLLARFREREAGYDRFERSVEAAVVTADVGVVMGRERVQPAADTATARRVGAGRPVARRFTNIYLWERGRWRWLARHANEEAAP